VGPLASLDAGNDLPLAPGELRIERSRVLVGTGSAPVELGEVQPHGKRPMAAADWARGLRLAEPARLA
jgi:methionyl-tRNA formyltransferase